MKTKYILEKQIIEKLCKHTKINSILELGSGNHSTPMIRQFLTQANKGYCLSLEDSKDYYNAVRKNCPDNQFGRVEYSPCIYDNIGLHYDYNLKDQFFDFIFIDGPGMSLIKDEKENLISPNSKIKQYLQKKRLWLNPNYFRGGGGTIFILNYVMASMKTDTIVMVESRKTAVLHYYQRYNNIFNFYNVGGQIGEKKFRKITKPKYTNKIKYRPTSVTLITKKESTEATNILKELKII